MGDRQNDYMTRGCNIVVHTAGLVHKADAPYQEYESLMFEPHRLSPRRQHATTSIHYLFKFGRSLRHWTFEKVDEKAALVGKTPYAVSKMASDSAWTAIQQTMTR